jgi:hypothetical protein
MSYRSYLGQTTSAPLATPSAVAPAAPVAAPAAPWVNGLTFLENLAQELNRVGGTIDTSQIQSDVTGESLANITNRSVRVVQTAPDTVVITIDYPQNTGVQQSTGRDTFPIVGTYAPMVLMRAYTLSQSGFALDTGLLTRRVTAIVVGLAISFWWGQWWGKKKEQLREKLREKYRRTA